MQEFSVARIGLDHALYRIGLRDEGLIFSLQVLILSTLATYLVLEVSWLRKLSDAATCSLVALYSMIFFYHRFYDAVILVLPLAFTMAGTRRAIGPARWLYALQALAQLVALHPIGRMINWIQEGSWGWGVWGSVSRGIVLPGVTWSILVAMTALGSAAWLEGRRRMKQRQFERGEETTSL